MLSRLPDCVLTVVLGFAGGRSVLRRVSRRYRAHVDRWLLPSASAPLCMVVPLDPRVGGRRAWEDLLSAIAPVGGWAHCSISLVFPAIPAVSPRDPRPARLAAWPTLINCLRAACSVGVAKHVSAIQLEFGVPYVDRIDAAALHPFGILSVTPEEVRQLLSQTSLVSFVLRAAASDRASSMSKRAHTALHPLIDRIGFGLARCLSLRRLELVDATLAIYGTDRTQPHHGVTCVLPLVTHLLLSTPLSSVRIEGVSASLVETEDFWEAVSGLSRSIEVHLVDTAIVVPHCFIQYMSSCR
jgi:hypothetical protein